MLKFAILSVLVCVALAQNPLPPVVKFVNGPFTGVLQAQGLSIPLSGRFEYLQGSPNQLKSHIVANANGQQITTDTWETADASSINSWEIISTDPTTCQKQTLSGSTLPQCGTWTQSNGVWSLNCQVNVNGVTATIAIQATVQSGLLAALQENTTVSGTLLTSENIAITNPSNQSPPPASDFTLPSLCQQVTRLPGEHKKVPHSFFLFNPTLNLLSSRLRPIRKN